MASRCRAKWYEAAAESIQQVPGGSAAAAPAARIQQVQQVFVLASTAHLLLEAPPRGSSSSSVGIWSVVKHCWGPSEAPGRARRPALAASARCRQGWPPNQPPRPPRR